MTSGRPDFSREIEKVQAQKGSSTTSGDKLVNANTVETLIDIQGKGKVLCVLLHATYEDMTFRLFIDGNTIRWCHMGTLSPLMWVTSFSEVNYGTLIKLTKYDTINGYFCFEIGIPFEFRSSFKITAFNPHLTLGYRARAGVDYNDLT